jgi:hypothetical protein
LPSAVDSSLVSPGEPASAPVVRPAVFSHVPPLGWMAAGAALADLFINRIVLRSWEEDWPREMVLQLDRWGTFARNLAVISALVATAFVMWAFVSRKNQLPLSARIGIASFGGAFLPVIALITALPPAWTRPQLVLVVAGLAHALIVLIVLVGLRWRSTWPIVSALVLTMISSVLGIASLLVSLAGRQAFWEHTERLANALRWTGELAYLGVPIAIGLTVGIPWRTTRGKLAIMLSLATAAGVATGLSAWRMSQGSAFSTLFYGSFRLDMWLDSHPLVYGIPLGVAWAVAPAAVLTKQALRRQLGVAVLLLLCAGYAPRTPTELVITLLGVSLIARSAVARAHATPHPTS